MTTYEDLTPAQRDLYDRLDADSAGNDLRDLLQAEDAPAADKAAVAEVLGGPGAGAEFLQ